MPIRKFVWSLLVIGVVILGSSGAAYADCDGVRCKRVGIGLYVRADNLINIETFGDERQLACLPRDGRYIDLQKNHPNYKEIYAALLAATISGRGLEIRIRSGPNGECQLAYISDNVNHETKFPYVAKGLPNPRGAIIPITTDFLFDEQTRRPFDALGPDLVPIVPGVYKPQGQQTRRPPASAQRGAKKRKACPRSRSRVCCRLPKQRRARWMTAQRCCTAHGRKTHNRLCRRRLRR